jgi:haloacid dehalogenase superfamily, subfamily IA, variant 1 with third motif having Dx(3-4)D or Dx(3-4)E
MNCDSIIFDLDGTLWDSTEIIYDSWISVLEKLPDIERLPTKEDCAGVMGLSSEKLMKKLFPALSTERGAEIFQMCSDNENRILSEHGAILYDSLIETLETLSHTYPLFIVSNCGTGYIESFFKAHNTAKYFKDYLSYGATKLPKSENIQLLIKRHALKSPIYVGDTLWDYEAATAANTPFIFASYGFGNVPNVPEIHSPKDLIKLLSV